ncbi:MAG: cold shock domain-containing protein [Porphyromonadaceae bacterium]|nr:cold shock domain-containing protein [Porphyromonadaceae bacterium]
MPGYAEGTIQALKKGFGFIDVGLGENAFFHYKSLVQGLRFDQLIEGHRVEAELHRSEEGKLVASNVALIPD